MSDASVSLNSEVGRMRAPMLISSDPHAWLRPYLAALLEDRTFLRLAPVMQFAALCDAVAVEHPTKAAQMREWSPAAHEGTLRWVRSAITQSRAPREVELWTVRKRDRELRCLVRYVPSGLDLRLMQGGDFHRAELHRTADAANAKAAEWKAALFDKGWK